ncbi:putative lipid II flippase FtsW, partial [Candidatus Poribacteria bacterium]|nr:putative lipid II flippase FtsW [Candidatus Poribacteria bacterium]
LDSIFIGGKPCDKILLIALGILLPIGLVMVYSASNAISLEHRGDGYYFFKMQLLWCCIGLAAMAFTAYFNYRHYRRLAFYMLIISGALLVFVFVPGVGVEIGGGRRWVRFWKLTFQPVEFAKIALVVCVARLITKNTDDIKTFKRGVLPILLVLFFYLALIYEQPDFGSIIIMCFIVFVMLVIGGAKLYQIALVAAFGLALLFVETIREPYRLSRLKVFLNPWNDPEGAGYHIIQSFYALASGGILGRGLGGGIQKLHYLPTPHSDFIFAVIGEEWGFIGSAFIVSMFMVILWRGIHISLTTKNQFGSLLGLGITFLVSTQAMVNIGVVTGTLPTKGLTLPFISSGGSSMLASLAAVGILLNISRSRIDSSDFEEQ